MPALFAMLLVCMTGAAYSDEPTTASVMAALEESDWRQPDPANLLYMRLPQGEVVMELATEFAPGNVANIKTLVREKFFDGLAIIRSQDNYVAQWGDPAEEESEARPFGSAAATVAPEFSRITEGLDITTIDSRDAYADIVGFANGFPVGSNGEQVWLTHCYGMVGVARGNELDSGNGSSLYVITGHAPRHLDRNITLAGRVLSGIEHLTTLPRGTGPLGFYKTAAELTPIISVRMGDDIAAEDRAKIEVLRTDSEAFTDYVKSRTFRHEKWFVDPTGRIEICNIHPPVRTVD
jgi:cyclophilin family peptidyl-prolyl cis-trans isomerase